MVCWGLWLLPFANLRACQSYVALMSRHEKSETQTIGWRLNKSPTNTYTGLFWVSKTLTILANGVSWISDDLVP